MQMIGWPPADSKTNLPANSVVIRNIQQHDAFFQMQTYNIVYIQFTKYNLWLNLPTNLFQVVDCLPA